MNTTTNTTTTDTIEALEAKLARTIDVTQRAAIKARLAELREAEEAAAAAKLLRNEEARAHARERSAALAAAADREALALQVDMRASLTEILRGRVALARATRRFIAARERRLTALGAAREHRGGPVYVHSGFGPSEASIDATALGIIERANNGLGSTGIDAAILAAVNDLVGGGDVAAEKPSALLAFAGGVAPVQTSGLGAHAPSGAASPTSSALERFAVPAEYNAGARRG